MITGTISKLEVNGYGYSTIWVQGTRYGADKKGAIPAQVGDSVSFEAFEKPGKPDQNGNVKNWPTFQFATVRKVSAAGASTASVITHVTTPSTSPKVVGDSWADKDPRITYQGVAKFAIDYVDIVLRNSALPLPKADKDKLGVIQAFTDETIDRFFRAAYAAKVPAAKQPMLEAAPEAATAAVEELQSDEEWA